MSVCKRRGEDYKICSSLSEKETNQPDSCHYKRRASSDFCLAIPYVFISFCTLFVILFPFFSRICLLPSLARFLKSALDEIGKTIGPKQRALNTLIPTQLPPRFRRPQELLCQRQRHPQVRGHVQRR